MIKFFQESRSLTPMVAKEWLISLFDLVSSNAENARDTIYSMAFYISYFNIHSTRNSESFAVSSELFDLLDDLIRQTDAMTCSDLRKSRMFTYQELKECNERYINCDLLKNNERLQKLYMEEMNNGGDCKFDESFDEEFLMKNMTLEQQRNIERLLQKLHNSSVLPLFYNLVGTRVEQRDSVNNSNNSNTENYLFKKLTPLRRYMHYVNCVKRYDYLEGIIKKIKLKRNVNIIPIYLPDPRVWQTGTSCLLWIVLHTIATLSVSRGNIYNCRLIVLLKNLSFFIWCGECFGNWKLYGGEAYFEYLYNIHTPLKYHIPLDIVLLRIHNNIARHCPLADALNEKQLLEIYRDYKEFIDTQLLKRPHIPRDNYQWDYGKNRIVGIL